MQTPDSSSGCFSINDKVCEDEQIHRVTSTYFFVESIILITHPRINDLIFKPCFIPWEPPRI